MTRHSNGFTLIEILIVVFIMGVVALVLMPTFGPHDEQKIVGAASELADGLQYARDISKKTKDLHTVRISPSLENFLIIDHLSQPVYHPVDKKNYQVNFTGHSIYDGVDVVSVNGNTSVADILFNSHGQVPNDITIIIVYTDHSRNIIINSRTGRVSVE